MPPRRVALLALCAAVLGCQDYRFNPVGRCLLQPGQLRIQLESLTTADILFVVDDSGSMARVQQNLADNFSQFITQLAAIQADRKSRALEPLEFHIAITTSSVFTKNNAGTSCGGSPLTCNITNPQAPAAPYSYACTQQGAVCGDLVDHYYQCNGSAQWPGDGTAYPAGDFVAQAGNAKVLHFTKTLDYTDTSPTSPLGLLMAQFSANIRVGDCGSGMEQHFEASRLAVKKAFGLDGLSQASGVAAGEWGHPSAKMVLVWVGNEDDCSNPKDRLGSLLYSGTPGNDVCTTESAKPLASQKLFPVEEYAAFFTGQGRPVGAAFIYPGVKNGDGSFTPGDCSNSVSVGYGPGRRYQGLVNGLRSRGVKTLEASVCDTNFGSTLKEIADLVQPLEALTLPTVPVASDLIRFRIVEGDRTVKVCAGPDTGLEWWFVDCNVGAVTGGTPAGSLPSKCIAIKRGGCEANPGQTYVAEYLGRLTESTCTTVGTPSQQCASLIFPNGGGNPADWTCQIPTGQTAGTCLCN